MIRLIPDGVIVPTLLNIALTIFAILLALILITAWLISGVIIRRRKPDPPNTPADHGLPYEHVTFAARDGVQLGGWLVAEKGSRRPTVIFCPGITGSMDGDTHFLPAFSAAGFDVLQFDWRAHGISDGQRCTFGVREIEDVLGAVDLLQSRGITKIGLMGFSMGGAVALRAVARDARILCVVSDGGFVHVTHAIGGFMREKVGLLGSILTPLVLWMTRLRLGGIDLREADPLNEAGKIAPRSVLFIHGSNDPYVPISDQDAIVAAAGEPKSLWRVEGAGHREAHERAPEEYRQKVIGFFKANLW
jgi:dipeptidyl aminopeptidase/acylaminoacyl peptidase